MSWINEITSPSITRSTSPYHLVNGTSFGCVPVPVENSPALVVQQPLVEASRIRFRLVRTVRSFPSPRNPLSEAAHDLHPPLTVVRLAMLRQQPVLTEADRVQATSRHAATHQVSHDRLGPLL